MSFMKTMHATAIAGGIALSTIASGTAPASAQETVIFNIPFPKQAPIVQFFMIPWANSIAEATNGEGTEFGDERLLECMRACASDITPRDLVEKLLAGVREFTVGEPQSDDITLLVVRYRGAA